MQKKYVAIAVFLALVVVALFLMLGFFDVSSVATDATAPLSDGGAQQMLAEIAATGSVASLKLFDTAIGDGQEAKTGDTIAVHYTGVLPDGTVFDSSVQRGEPIVFTLGAGQVIQGWEQGFAGMKVGGRRLIAIPPELGYGANAVGTIPANSTLIFDVELVDIVETGSAQ